MPDVQQGYEVAALCNPRVLCTLALQLAAVDAHTPARASPAEQLLLLVAGWQALAGDRAHEAKPPQPCSPHVTAAGYTPSFPSSAHPKSYLRCSMTLTMADPTVDQTALSNPTSLPTIGWLARNTVYLNLPDKIAIAD